MPAAQYTLFCGQHCAAVMQDAQIAQLVEQRTENPRVTGSIPVLGTDSIVEEEI